MPEATIASEVLSASLGGAISASILYPLEVLKTKMQAEDQSSASAETAEAAGDNNDDDDKINNNKTSSGIVKLNQHHHSNNSNTTTKLSMVAFAQDLYRKEGWTVFFRGVETSAFQSALEKSLYFFAYTALKSMHRFMTGEASLGTLSNLALGCMAEWAHLPLSLPIDVWTTKIQTSREAPLTILLTMLSDPNQKFYKGLSAYYILCFKPAIQYTIYEQVKAVWLQSKTRRTLTALEAFVLGMIARTISTVAVFPFLRAKVLLQTRNSMPTVISSSASSSDATTTAHNVSTMEVLRQQYQASGLSGLYHGLGPELTRGIFSAALMLMIKERIAETVQLMLSSSSDHTSSTTRRRQRGPMHMHRR